MELSNRLQNVADMVSKGNVAADVGCDHGYVAIYLVQNKICDHVIAMDINKGPIHKAKEHILKYALLDAIEIRLSDGVAKLQKGEADTLICAGMGGKLVIHILEEGYDVVACMKELILQPQSEVHLVREYLRKQGFFIEEERMILEDDKFYPMMRAVKREQSEEKDGATNEMIQKMFDQFGGYLLKQKDPILFQYLNEKQKSYDAIIDQFKKQILTIKQKTRLQELLEEIQFINKALEYYF